MTPKRYAVGTRRHTDAPPRGEAPWIAIAIFVLFMALICSPFVFLFMEMK